MGVTTPATQVVLIDPTTGNPVTTSGGSLGVSGGGGPSTSTNLTQVAGTAVSVNAGNADAGTQRVAVDGTDATGITQLAGGVGTRGWLSAIFAGLGTTADASTATTVIGRLQKLVSLVPASLGQKLSALSFAVVLPSDQSAIPVTSSPAADTTQSGAISVVDTVIGAALAVGALSSAVPTANSFQTFTIAAQGLTAITITPALSAGSLAFEGSSDGTNYGAIAALVPGASLPILTTAGATFVRANTAGLTKVRVRAVTGATFGDGALTVAFDASVRESIVSPVSGAVNQGTAAALTAPWYAGISDGTTLANVLAGDSGQSSQIVTGARKTFTFTTTTVQAVGATDCSNYRGIAIQLSSVGTSALANFQTSVDNVNWTTMSLPAAGLTNVPFSNTNTVGTVYFGPIPGQYIRINVTGISAGTLAGTITLTSWAPPSLVGSVVQSGTWTVAGTGAAGAAVSGNPFRAGASDGTNTRDVRSDTTGKLVTGLFGTQVLGASGDVANVNAVATLAAAAAVTTYITGFEVTATGSTAGSVVDVTVTDGTWTKTYVLVAPAGVSTAAAPLMVEFTRPVAASAVNTAITVTCPALGAGSAHCAVNATGFQL